VEVGDERHHPVSAVDRAEQLAVGVAVAGDLSIRRRVDLEMIGSPARPDVDGPKSPLYLDFSAHQHGGAELLPGGEGVEARVAIVAALQGLDGYGRVEGLGAELAVGAAEELPARHPGRPGEKSNGADRATAGRPQQPGRPSEATRRAFSSNPFFGSRPRILDPGFCID
jgi:hypothetical protein